MHELVALSPSSFYVRWSDQWGEGPADGLRATVYHNERLVLAVDLGNQPAAGSAEIDDPNAILQPSTRYCVGLRAYLGSGSQRQQHVLRREQPRVHHDPRGSVGEGRSRACRYPPR